MTHRGGTWMPQRTSRALRRSGRGLALGLALPWLLAWSFFDPFHENVEKGNRAASEGNHAEAVQRYDEAGSVNPSSPIPDFNRGLAYAAQGEGEAARDAFRGAAAASDSTIAADAWYNLGNVQLDAKEFEPAIQSYLSSLDLDPNDPDTRRNLEIATRMLEQQQQQQQQQQSDDQQDDKDEKDDSQQQSEEQPPDSSQDESQAPEQQPESEEEQPQQSEERLSREDAERLLNAIQSDELKVLEQLQDEQEGEAVVEYDW